jgi:hypothetical protein
VGYGEGRRASTNRAFLLNSKTGDVVIPATKGVPLFYTLAH